jgi:hypothetical protein
LCLWRLRGKNNACACERWEVEATKNRILLS